MTDVSIKATLEGATQTKAGLEDVQRSLEGLKRAGEAFQAEQSSRAAATQKLKDHTAELVKKFNEEELAMRAAKEAGDSMAATLGNMALKAAGSILSIGAVVETIRQIASEGREADLAQVKLEGILRATGMTAGMTAKQLDELSNSLAKGTRFDNTAIKEAMTVMLTFGDVQGDVFTRAIKHAQNLSEMYGMDLSSSARMLGRSLEQPGQGIQNLGRYIGALDPELKKHIKDLDEAGKTAEAQGLLLDTLDKKFGNFAETVGTSAPASMARMQLAWKNLMQELGQGGSGETFGYIEGKLNNLTGWAANWETIKRSIESTRLLGLKDDPNASPEERARAEQRLAGIRAQIGKEGTANAEEGAKREEAANAAKEEAAKRSAERLAALRKKQGEEADRQRKKDVAAYEDSVKRELELTDLEIKQGNMTTEEKIAQIDMYMEHEERGSAFGIMLLKKREQALDELTKFHITQLGIRENAEARADAEGVKTYNRDLAERKKATTQAADDEIALIRHTVFETNDLKIQALEALSEKYKDMGEEGKAAYDKVRRAIRDTKTEAELMTERLRSIFGRSTFDIVTVFGSMFKSIQEGFYGIFTGTKSISDSIKGVWKSTIDAIVQEFARLAARWVMTQLSMSLGLGGLGGSTGANAAAGAAGALGGNLIGGIGNVVGGIGNFVAGGFQDLGVGLGSQGIADIGNWLNGLFSGELLGDLAFPGFGTILSLLGGTGLGKSLIGGVGSVLGGVGDVIGDIVGGIGDIFGFQHGGDQVVTSPTLFMAGETGPEFVSVSPLAGAAGGSGFGIGGSGVGGSGVGGGGGRGGRGGAGGPGGRGSAGVGGGSGNTVVNHFHGPNVMDPFSLRRFVRQQEKLISQESTRHA